MPPYGFHVLHERLMHADIPYMSSLPAEYMPMSSMQASKAYHRAELTDTQRRVQKTHTCTFTSNTQNNRPVHAHTHTHNQINRQAHTHAHLILRKDTRTHTNTHTHTHTHTRHVLYLLRPDTPDSRKT